VDSSVVNREIRAEIRPLLKERGFRHFTSRTAWRVHPDRVDVVNFQSFNSYNAAIMGTTTFSFAVNLGCFLRYIPNQYPPDVYPDAGTSASLHQGDAPRPREYDCQMRARLRRSYSDGCKDRQIWSIDERGSNVTKALHDVRMVLSRDGIPWFQRFTTPNDVYDILANTEENMETLWGFGRPGSPIRCYYLGYAARAAGFANVAKTNLLLAASTKSFEKIAGRIRNDAECAS
jgi:hypothetical protein